LKTLLPLQQVISYLSGTGTEDTVLNVTVTAAPEQAWMLTKKFPAALHVMPSLNGTLLGEGFNISMTATEQEVQGLLAEVRLKTRHARS